MSTRDDRRPPAGDGLFILGLVGPAGSGKSSVAHALEEDGAVLIEADHIGHEVTDRDPEVRVALAGEYGEAVYRPDGTLDRARVADRVFRDPEALARLNALVHPRIVSRIQEDIAGLAARGFGGVVVVDAALMLDWGLQRSCDAVLAVTADEDAQVRRLMRARGWSEDDARRRLAAQRTNAEFSRAADETIRNDGTVETLLRSAREALKRLRAARANGPGAARRLGDRTC